MSIKVESPPTVLAWHFVRDDGYLRDGREKAEVGKLLTLSRKPVLCEHGFHGSERPLDALQYAPGSLICRVEIGGTIVRGGDKLCGSQRTVLWMADATKTLHEFSAWAAEWILDKLEAKGYKIDPRSRAAVEAKRAWLRGEIADEQLAAARAAAGAAAWAAAGDAAWAAAEDAAWAAAGDAAWAAAGDAAWAALNARLEEMLGALESSGV